MLIFITHLLVIWSLPFLPSFNPSVQRRRREGSDGGILGGGRQELQRRGNRVRIQLFICLFLLRICSLSDLCSFSLPSIPPHSVDEQRGAAGESRTAGGGNYNAAEIGWEFNYSYAYFYYEFALYLITALSPFLRSRRQEGKDFGMCVIFLHELGGHWFICVGLHFRRGCFLFSWVEIEGGRDGGT